MLRNTPEILFGNITQASYGSLFRVEAPLSNHMQVTWRRINFADGAFRQLGKALNVLDYEFNYVSFWALDTLSQCLAELQINGFSVDDQKVFLGWFSYVLRFISLSGAAREDIFMILQDLFKKSVIIIEEGGDMPYPADLKADSADHIHQKLSTDLKSIVSSNSGGSVVSKRKTLSKNSSKKSITLKSTKRSIKSSSKRPSMGSKISVNSEGKLGLKLNAFYKIIEILYKIFADRFKYSVISLAYSAPAITVPVDIPFEFNEIKLPKPAPVLISPVKDQPSKRKKSVSKGSKNSKGKGKRKSSVDTKKEKSGKKGKSKGKSKESTDAAAEVKSDKMKKPRSKSTTSTDAAAKDKSDKMRKSRSKSKASTGTAAEDKETKDSKRKISKSKKPLSTTGKEGDKEVDKNDIVKSLKGTIALSKKGGKQKKKSKSVSGEIDKAEEKTIKTKGGKKEKRSKKSKSSSVKTFRGSKESTLNSASLGRGEIDKIIQVRRKLFERAEGPEIQLEKDNIKPMNEFILPLSEAVDEKFVENLIKTLLPPGPGKEEVQEDNVASIENTRKSSVKGGKSKKGKKKK